MSTTWTSNPTRQLAHLASALATRCSRLTALLVVVVASSPALAQTVDGPRRLPAPEVPVDRLPPITPETRAVAPPSLSAPGPAPYLGPPMMIDGPANSGGPPPGIGAWPEEIGKGSGPLPELILPDDPFAETLDEEEFFSLEPQKLSAYKSGFFQKLSFSAGWYGNSTDPTDLGGTEIETFLTVALPAPIVEWPLLITPGLNVTFIDGPTVTDLPNELYLTYVDFMWLPKVWNHLTLLLAVAPTLYGDFNAHEFRFTGKALAIYDAIPERLQVVAGVLYLNRDNITLLAAGGIIWSPTDWTRLELLFPKPKLGLRINCQPGYEDWIFTTAEFGGNTWPILRTSGTHDEVTYTDYRILSGFERKLNGGAGYRLEAGYVFGRSIRYESTIGDFDPQDTILIRGAIVY